MISESSSHSLIRTLLIYSVCVPLAVFLGYLMAQPMDYSTLVVLGLVLFVLTVPLLLRWHHLWLIASWNLGAVLMFVPGRPYLWLVMAWLSLAVSVVQYIIHPRLKFLRAPAVTRPLVLLAIVALVTAKMRGGIGLSAAGSEVQGGGKYVYLLGAIVAYFALISQRVSPRQARLCVALYFLGSLAGLIGELPAHVGPSFYFIFQIFPVTGSGLRALNDAPVGRIESVAAAGSAVLYWMLCRYGIQDLLSPRRPGRLLLLLFFAGLTLFGGYRSALILMALTFAFVFYFEGLMRSRLLPLLALGLLLCGVVVAAFSDHMPFAVQRSLSFLPLKIDPFIKAEAQESSEWRLRMWHHVLPDVPRYLLLGKGYSLDPKEMAKVQTAAGGEDTSAGAELAGDFHSGPLSVIVPLGIPGALAFLWFLYAATRALYSNYRFGHPAYRRFNTFLLAYFVAKIILFFLVFGALASELVTFTGLIGLSISLNGGIAKPAAAPRLKLRLQAFKFRPPIGRPVAALPRVGAQTSSPTR